MTRSAIRHNHGDTDLRWEQAKSYHGEGPCECAPCVCCLGPLRQRFDSRGVGLMALCSRCEEGA